MVKHVAVILASGSGTRAAFPKPKQLIALGGKPLITYPLICFETHPAIEEIAIVTNNSCRKEIEEVIAKAGICKVKQILSGGQERHHSTLAAIRAYAGDPNAKDIRFLFHDAVRPLITAAIIDNVVAGLQDYGAVNTAVPATDTIIGADPESLTITDIPDRKRMWMSQTPQAFHYDVIKAAYDRALEDPLFGTTDDCGVVLKYLPDQPIHIVRGELSNMKLTYADDLQIIEQFLTMAKNRSDEAIHGV